MPNREEEGLFAEFHLHPVLQPEESQKEARPVYRDEVYIRIQIKGQKNQVVDRKMRPNDEHDFPRAWVKWKQKDAKITEGTPITALPGVGPSLEIELEVLGVRTVEDMAALTDAGISNIRGGRMIQQRAKAYLAACGVKPDKPVLHLPKKDESPVDVDLLSRDRNVIHKTKRERLQ